MARRFTTRAHSMGTVNKGSAPTRRAYWFWLSGVGMPRWNSISLPDRSVTLTKVSGGSSPNAAGSSMVSDSGRVTPGPLSNSGVPPHRCWNTGMSGSPLMYQSRLAGCRKYLTPSPWYTTSNATMLPSSIRYNHILGSPRSSESVNLRTRKVPPKINSTTTKRIESLIFIGWTCGKSGPGGAGCSGCSVSRRGLPPYPPDQGGH